MTFNGIGKLALLPSIFLLTVLLDGCGTPHSTPKLIVADGQTYAACRDTLWVSSTSGLLGGETTYEIKFTDADGIDHDIRGIKHLEMSDLPSTVPSTLPTYLPDPKTDRDKDGNAFVEERVYTFNDGSTAIIRNGRWQPLERKNPLCQPIRK